MRIGRRLFSTATKRVNNALTFTKAQDFSQWYVQALLGSEFLDYSDISGCHILRPWGHSVWSFVRKHLEGEFSPLGIQDAYFPLLISEAALQQEAAHLSGFAPEVAWVTRVGRENLAQPLAIRPTSETAMYPSYARWIQSWRDLPLRLNQWCNVLRWEFSNPQPLIRSREFLWQEGHSAFVSQTEAIAEVQQILSIYQNVYRTLLAVPSTAGVKSQREKFAGADSTSTVETFVPEAGKAIQGATSHNLGQNFSRMFGIQFIDKDGEQRHAWQTSWGFTTRSLGVMVMTHGDDRGLILPPRVSPIQVVLIPVGISSKGKHNELVRNECQRLRTELERAGIRSHVDLDDHVSPGWKFNHWELKGVPLRIEIGPKELQSPFVSATLRHTIAKKALSREALVDQVRSTLDQVQDELLLRATERYRSQIKAGITWNDFERTIADGQMALTPWCEEASCETRIKERTGAKSLCIPNEQPFESPEGHSCPNCTGKAHRWSLFGRSF